MFEFENGFLFTTELLFRGDWWIHPLALSPESCTCLPLLVAEL
jgi:hypothetical protein